MIPITKQNILLVISAPSGAGKTTLCDRLMDRVPGIQYSVSCTTRPPRDGEKDGEAYHFLTEAEFEERLNNNEFIEHARVYGHYYGTLREHVVSALASGHDVLMDLDVQGAAILRETVRQADEDDPLRRAYVDLFIAPPSLEILEQRLTKRGKDLPDVIERRMQNALEEISHWREYRYVLINDDLDESYDALRSIVVAERLAVRA